VCVCVSSLSLSYPCGLTRGDALHTQLATPCTARVYLMASSLGAATHPVGCLAGSIAAVALWTQPLSSSDAAVFSSGVDYFDRGEVPTALQVGP
jgi:hypothetical protein